MARYALGEDSAFAEVYDDLAPRLYRYLMHLTRDPERAADLLQDTMLHIHAARGRFVAGSAVAPWAYAIARRLFIDSARRLQSRRAAQPALEALAPTESETPAEMFDAHELAGALAEAFEDLPPNQREAMLLVREHGMSFADAAAVLGTTSTSVKLRAFRALQALRAVVAGGRSRGQR